MSSLTSPLLRVHLLGAPCLEREGKPLIIERRKVMALLSYLVLTEQTHLRDAIATLLWPDSGQTLARANLRHTLSMLKQILGDQHLEIERDRIALKPGATLWVDVLHFQTLLASCKSHQHGSGDLCAACLPQLLEAITFNAEQFMVGFSLADSSTFDDWQRSQQQQLTQALSDALDRLVDYFTKNGDSKAAIPYALRRLGLDTLDETAHRQLMQVYAGSGQLGLAQRQFEQCTEILARELGVTPSAQTSRLMQELHDGTSAAVKEVGEDQLHRTGDDLQKAQAANDWHPMNSLRHNLPMRLPALIGREHDLHTLQTMLQRNDVHLVTLVGPGGVGKTQLSLQLAASLLGEFADGVFFVSLASLREPDLVLSTLAQIWGLQWQGSQPLFESVAHYLRHKRMLLVLDNFEHLMEAAPLISQLLNRCAYLCIVVTSRELLNVQGEHLYPVPPLSLPKHEEGLSAAVIAKAAAVQLFVQRAQAIMPSFMLDETNAADIAHICTYLDGLPLAIELVAARIRLLSPRALRQRLLEARVSPFALLQGGARDAPLRHRTLKDAIGWSYELLTMTEQRLFRLLAVFAGGCTLETIECVSALAGGVERESVLETVASLVNKSLVQQTVQPDGESRFSLLEMMREFGLEKLQAHDELTAALYTHAECFALFAEKAAPVLAGPDHLAWIARLNADHDNCRAALQWAITHQQAQVAMRLAGALWSYWMDRGYYREGRQFCSAILRLAGAATPTPARARVLTGQGALSVAPGDVMEALAALRDAKSIFREAGDERGLAMALEQLVESWCQRPSHDISEIYQYCVEGIALYEKLNDPVRAAKIRQGFGYLKYYENDFGATQAIFEAVITLYQEHQYEGGMGAAWLYLGRTLFQQQKFAEAAPYFAQVLHRAQARGDQGLIGQTLYFQGRVAYYQADMAKAQTLFEESLHIGREIGVSAYTAYSLAYLSEIALARGDIASARTMLSEGLMLGFQHADPYTVSLLLPRCAMLASTFGQRAQSVQLTAAAISLFHQVKPEIPANDQMVFDMPLAAVRDSLSVEDFAQAWASGEQMTMAEAVELAMAVIAGH